MDGPNKDTDRVGVYDRSGATGVKHKTGMTWLWIALLVILAIIALFVFGIL